MMPIRVNILNILDNIVLQNMLMWFSLMNFKIYLIDTRLSARLFLYILVL